ncbi:sensor domain-containing diguanylate cyclase [Vibrio sp. Vb1018]|uniref:sensor domain-containing diguanylate cyclase n=1 Tax=Vibrio sp. Vb1018 TaxID=3074636 RepID=UPI0029645E05|nr:sensor domain-containing diguanylate cyclase [Vibrio sp. Vb1018]MDW1823256.1 sensor domain-containing diguanylate cyclase [Vibrio sp. Vb1018]
MSITLFNTFFSIYQVQREQLIRNSMEINYSYAQKMAEVTEVFTKSAMRQVEYSADILGRDFDSKELIDHELNRLQEQAGLFNSTVLVDNKGTIVSTSKNISKAEGIQLTDETLLQSLNKVQPFITKPFVSPKGNYLVCISYPVFSPNKEFLGYLGGTIYLKDNNVLNSLLDNHSYSNGSYLYVVDSSKAIIYHPDKSLIGKVVDSNYAVDLALEGGGGSIETISYFGEEVLAGYSPVNNTGWGIIIQRSKSVSFDILDGQLHSVLVRTIPLSLFTFIFIWVASSTISKPLWQLAMSINKANVEHADSVSLKQIKPWYFEAFLLKSAVIKTFTDVSNTIEKLQNDRLTDVMTGLTNRRGFEEAVDKLEERRSPLSVMAIDIDFFKKVNDTYGHSIGDDVLKELSNLIKCQSRKTDILCRTGGEEFIVFLAEMSIESAFAKAERLRKNVEQYGFAHIDKLTISIGISHWMGTDQSLHESIIKADDALYRAKRNGRNRCEVNV